MLGVRVSEVGICSLFFFFNDTATTEIYTLSLHDALPIFGSVVADTHVWLAAPSDQIVQFTRHAGARQGAIHDGCQCFACAIIYNTQHTEPLIVFESLRHEVQ